MNMKCGGLFFLFCVFFGGCFFVFLTWGVNSPTHLDVKLDHCLFYRQHSSCCQRLPKDSFKKLPLVRVDGYENNGAVRSHFED